MARVMSRATSMPSTPGPVLTALTAQGPYGYNASLGLQNSTLIPVVTLTGASSFLPHLSGRLRQPAGPDPPSRSASPKSVRSAAPSLKPRSTATPACQMVCLAPASRESAKWEETTESPAAGEYVGVARHPLIAPALADNSRPAGPFRDPRSSNAHHGPRAVSDGVSPVELPAGAVRSTSHDRPRPLAQRPRPSNSQPRKTTGAVASAPTGTRARSSTLTSQPGTGDAAG